MKIKLAFTVLFILCFSKASFTQELTSVSVTKEEKRDRVSKKYVYSDRVDGEILLVLFRNHRYRYSVNASVRDAFSSGKWKVKDGRLFLRSEIQKDSVPIKMSYVKAEESVNRSPFLVPENLKGEKIGDARIFINGDTSSYCFPYFDTCIGSYESIKSIMVDFGNGYRSNWVKINNNPKVRILVTAKVYFSLNSFITFKRREYLISGDTLNLIE